MHGGCGLGVVQGELYDMNCQELSCKDGVDEKERKWLRGW